MTIEWFHAWNALFWGLFLLPPFPVMDYGEAWVSMKRLLPEDGWALLLIMAGALHLHALYHGSFRARALLMFWHAVFWLFVAITLSRIGSPMVPTVALLSAFCGWTYLRLRGAL